VRTERFQNPIIFFIDDGEEAGLLGAEAFAADPAKVNRVAAVINLENRGTTGPAYLFETSRNNRLLIPIAARTIPRPMATSLFYTIYELLPNDTDVTVFKRAGKTAVNFAAIGNVWSYHTPLDDLAHVDARTVQHHGDNTLAMLRGLGNADLHAKATTNAVYFDLLAFTLLWWPEQWTLPLAIVALAALLVASALLRREGRTRGRAVWLGIAAFLATVAAAAVAGLLVATLAAARAHGATWMARPVWAIASMWLLGLAAAIAIAVWAHKRAGFDGLYLGYGIVWAVIGVVLAATLPGTSYLFLLPALLMAVAAIVRAVANLDESVMAIVPAALAAILIFPLGAVLYDALGQLALTIICVVIAIAGTTFAPLVPARRLAIALGTLAIVCAIVSLAMPTYTKDRPARVVLNYKQEGTSAEWLSGAKLTGFDAQRRVYPWNRSQWWTRPAPMLALPPVELRVVADDHKPRRTMTVQVTSHRGAQRVALFFRTEATVDQQRVNGVAIPPSDERLYQSVFEGWRRLSARGTGDATFTITTRGGRPIELAAADYSYGLPAEGKALAEERNAHDAVTSDDGDVAITITRLK